MRTAMETALAMVTRFKAGSDPDDPDSTPSDSDGDGKVDDKNADSDGDGVSDGDEIKGGFRSGRPGFHAVG